MSLGSLTLNAGSGGSDLPVYSDSGSRKWVGGVTAWLSSAGTPDTIQTVDLAHGLPVQPQTGSTWTVTGSGGTFPVTDSGGSLTVDDGGGSLTVDGTVAVSSVGGTVAVSGAVTANAGTGTFAVSAASLPLPAGAATAADQATGNAALSTLAGAVQADSLGNAAGVVAVGGFVDGVDAFAVLKADAQGHLLTAPGVYLNNTASWDAGTAGGSVLDVFTLSGAPAALVQFDQTSTLTAGAVTAEVTYDGTNWVTIPADCVIDPASTTQATVGLPYSFQANTNKPLLLLTRGAQGLRLKLSTPITGTGSVTAYYALLPHPGVYTVAGAVAATQSGTWSARLQDGSGNAITSATRGSERPLSVQVVDGSGAQVTTFGGGTQYTEGDADATITGTALLWEDAADTLRAVSAAKPLPVNIISGAGSGGTAIADGAAFTADTTSLTPIGGYRDDTSPATVTEGDAAACRITTNRALHVNLRDASGNEVSVGGGTQYDEDAASAGAEKLTLAGAVRRDAAASSSGTDGDYSTINTDAGGRLWTRVGTIDGGTITTVTDVVHVDDNGSSLTVDGTVSVSGTVTVDSELTTADLDTGAGTDTRAVVGLAYGASGGGVLVSTTNPLPVGDNGGSLTVDGTVTANAGTGTFAVSAASLPLPTGAATAAKQPALGTAGTASADVITVQGVASMTALKVDGSAATQPVSGTVTANIGTSGSLALESGGNLAALAAAVAAEDSASADADKGVRMLAVRKAAPANTSGTDGDYEVPQMSAGRLWCSATIDAALPAGANAIGKLASNSGVTIGAVEIAAAQTLGTVTTVTTVSAVTSLTQMNGQAIAMGTGTRSAGTQRVTIATDDVVPASQSGAWAVGLSSGSNLAGRVNPEPQTANGLSVSRTIDFSGANQGSTVVKASAGQVYTVYATNTNAAVRYLKVYNKATGPTSADTPVLTLPIPGNTAGAGFAFDTGGMGVAFGTGIGIRVTTGYLDNDAAAAAAGEVIVNVLYK